MYTSLIDRKGPDFWWSLTLDEILENTDLDASKFKKGEVK